MLRNYKCKAKYIIADVRGFLLLAFNPSNSLTFMTPNK